MWVSGNACTASNYACLGVFPVQVPSDPGCERVHAVVTGVTCESEDVLDVVNLLQSNLIT
jgi:hypothetical protein